MSQSDIFRGSDCDSWFNYRMNTLLFPYNTENGADSEGWLRACDRQARAVIAAGDRRVGHETGRPGLVIRSTFFERGSGTRSTFRARKRRQRTVPRLLRSRASPDPHDLLIQHDIFGQDLAVLVIVSEEPPLEIHRLRNTIQILHQRIIIVISHC